MDIIEYDAGYKEAFIRFNTDWITDNFGFLEKEDLETFGNIENELAGGAMIFLPQKTAHPLRAAWQNQWKTIPGKSASLRPIKIKNTGAAEALYLRRP